MRCYLHEPLLGLVRVGGHLEKAIPGLEQELDSVWELWNNRSCDRIWGGHHGRNATVSLMLCGPKNTRPNLFAAPGSRRRKDYIAGMQVWNFADFAAVQSVMRVGGLT